VRERTGILDLIDLIERPRPSHRLLVSRLRRSPVQRSSAGSATERATERAGIVIVRRCVVG
tara:strand:- start:199 stop:381 length:183 start_codon:yes stop_codon:yes gene_type:complete